MYARSRRSVFTLALVGVACNASTPPENRPNHQSKTEPDKPESARADAASDRSPTTTAGQPSKPKPIAPTEDHPFSALDLLAMDRISDPQLTPGGSSIVFVRRSTDLEQNKGRTDLWTVDISGKQPKALTSHSASDSSPRVTSDGTVYFLSTRSGSSQVWKTTLQGVVPTQVTDLPLDVTNLRVSPSGEHLAVTADVFVDCKDLQCTRERLDKHLASNRTGQRYDQLFVRHWDTYKDGRRSHLWVLTSRGEDEPIDVTAGMDADVPSKPFGGSSEFTFSPDGKTLVFAARDVGTTEAWSTNFDLFAVNIDGKDRRNLTASNKAWDTHPVFSSDGKTLVWAAMKRPGFESDRFRIMARSWPDGDPREVATDWDVSVRDMAFDRGDKNLWVTGQHLGQVPLFRVSLADGTVTTVADQGTHDGLVAAGSKLVFGHNDLRHPKELFIIEQDGDKPRSVTAINAAKVKAAKTGDAEQFQFVGAGGDKVYGYAVKPVDFSPDKKYPLAFLIHGGPQGSFGNRFHYRWNPQTYAGAGYAVVMIDFHGSTGYGQDFTDSIRGDWGGKPFIDLQRGLKAARDRYPWIDGESACALGASYGGYMINWIAGNWPDGFKCLVNHDGVFDQRMMYYATEELWFPEWEHGGPYFENPKAYEKHNPAAHVDKWKSPMLVIHGALDYRVPLTQGLAAFTAAQRQGLSSEFLVFPDENHWVLSPANSLQWHETVRGWLDRHTARQTP